MSARPRSLARNAAPGFFVVARRRGGAPAAALVVWALALGACARKPVALAARVDGRPISMAQWSLEERLLGPPQSDGVEALESLIDQALILRQGRRLGLRFGSRDRAKALADAMQGVDPAVLEANLSGRGLTLKQWQDCVVRGAEVDAVVDRVVLSGLRASDQEVRDGYWGHLLRYRSPPRRVLRQIFTRTRGAAESAMRALELGEPFAEVASRRGQGPEAAQGGLLGAYSQNQLPASLARAAWALKPGAHSRIVASHWGYHILYYDSPLPADAGTFAQAEPRARASVLLQKEQAVYRRWLAGLRERAVIERWVVLRTPKRGTLHHEKGTS